MRAAITLLAVWGPFVFPVAKADDTKKDPVRRIDLSGYAFRAQGGNVEKPAEITSVEQLAKAFPTKEWQEKIKSQVNFETEKLLYFAWGGSGGDKLAFAVEKGKEGPMVVFSYSAGFTDDLRYHHYLFAVPKKSEWSLKK